MQGKSQEAERLRQDVDAANAALEARARNLEALRDELGSISERDRSSRQVQSRLSATEERLEATGIPPSFDEMKDALELKSKSGIHRLITALEERGFIRRLPNRARALEVLKQPQASASPAAASAGR